MQHGPDVEQVGSCPKRSSVISRKLEVLQISSLKDCSTTANSLSSSKKFLEMELELDDHDLETCSVYLMIAGTNTGFFFSFFGSSQIITCQSLIVNRNHHH